MTPQELEFLLAQQEGPNLEFKLEYQLVGQSRKLYLDEIAKDIISLANSGGTERSYLILGASDEIDASTGRRNARAVMLGEYSLGQFVSIVNNRCTPPITNMAYQEIEFNGTNYGILQIDSSAVKPHYCTRDLVTPKSRWPQNSVLVRRGDQIGVATPAETIHLATQARISRSSVKAVKKKTDLMKGVHAVLIRTPLDFQATINVDASSHSVLLRTDRANDRQIRTIISAIFTDLPSVDRDELGMVMTYLDSIEEPLEQLESLGAELFCIVGPEPYEFAGKPFSLNVANYFLVPRDCFIVRGDIDPPLVHKFSDHCDKFLSDFVEHIRSLVPIKMYGGLLNVWRKFGLDARLCTTCCSTEIEHSEILLKDGFTIEKLETMVDFLKKESPSDTKDGSM